MASDILPSLDTIAQVGTLNAEPSFRLLNTTVSNDKEVLQKRARAKAFSSGLSVGLIEAAEKQNSPLLPAYWRSYHCASVVSKHKDGKATSKYCKNRWCTVCSRIRTAKLIQDYLPTVRQWLIEDDLCLVTLTRPNVPGKQLFDEIRLMNSTFTKIAAAAKQKYKRGTGEKLLALRKTECSYNRHRDDFNPHLHILVKGKENAEYINSQWLKRNESANSKAQDIRPVKDENGLLEVFKYSTKQIVKVGNTRKVYLSALDTIYAAFRNTRTLQPYGFKQTASGASMAELEQKTTAPIERVYEWDRDQTDWVSTEIDMDLTTGEVFGVKSDYLSGYTISNSFKSFLDTAFILSGTPGEQPINRLQSISEVKAEPIRISTNDFSQLENTFLNSTAENMAIRVQRSRQKPNPENTKCVDRTSKWGNPYKVVEQGKTWRVIDKDGNYFGGVYSTKESAAGKAVELYKPYINSEIEKGNLDLSDLIGQNLACWCSLSSPCHADYLLSLVGGTPAKLENKSYRAGHLPKDMSHFHRNLTLFDSLE